MDSLRSVTTVDHALIEEACSLLGVSDATPLATGGQKVVLKVELQGSPLVLKVVVLGDSMPDGLERAHREVELLHRLDSEHLVKVRSELVELGDPTRGAAWLEEFLDGSDLRDLLGEPWAWSEVRQLGIEVSRGLSILHENHVVHRDLSPGNVRRLGSGSYKVIDPGFARHTLRTGITVNGQPGTPGYMSPEHVHQLSGAPSPASDIFEVGILLYEALTGAPPVPWRGDVEDYSRRLMLAEHAPLQLLRPDLTADEAAIVERCLHRQAARRLRNGHELEAALLAMS